MTALIEPDAVAQVVEMFIDQTLADQERPGDSQPLDTDNVHALHRAAAEIYALGYADGDRAASMRIQRQHYRAKRRAEATLMTALVTPDAVEAAARALADDWNPGRDPVLTAMFRDYAQSALAAAAPLIAQQTLEDAAIDLNNHAVAMRAPEAPETCQDADEGLCHHDATVAAYITASQRLTARAATLTPKDTP